MKSIIPNASAARKLTLAATQKRELAEEKALQKEIQKAVREETEKEARILSAANLFMKQTVSVAIAKASKQEQTTCSFVAPRSENVADRVAYMIQQSGYTVTRKYKETAFGEECSFVINW